MHTTNPAGGNFWRGARQGLITAGLNHAGHKGINLLKKNNQLLIPSTCPDCPILSTTPEAADHYFNGKGKDASLGWDVRKSLFTSKESARVIKLLISGKAKLRTSTFDVDLTEDYFHVGDTNVDYFTSCTKTRCRTDFKAFVRDGFREPLDIPSVEIRGGIPYNYIPWEYHITYKNPGYLLGVNIK